MDHSEGRQALSRRTLIQAVTGGGAVSMLGVDVSGDDHAPIERKGRIRQSLVHWCYQRAWPDVVRFCEVAQELGCPSIELIDPKDWPLLKQHGLTCAIAGSHGFRVGPNNREEWETCRAVLRERLGQCAEFGVKRLITFTGMAKGLSKAEGADNCVEFFKQIAPEAEAAGVTLCLEMLNTRDDTHPMKGHPGYQGDDLEYCVEIIDRVGSEHFKLLFDVYHVQIMHGDVIRRIHQHQGVIAHVHTAGVPGRGELDDAQEVNYPAVMRALVDIGYDGYVGQEFMPTRDPWEGLREAVATCDV